MMYKKSVSATDYNVSIDGYSMIMEECNPNESYNRRETIRHNIIGGTQNVVRGNYIVRDYSFTTHLLIDPEYPDVYDDVFKSWQSKPVEVISKYMGGKFNAECIVKRNPNDSPNYLSVEIQVIEIPTELSNIPNDTFGAPVDKISMVTVTSTKNNNKKDKNKGKGKNSKSKGKNSKSKGKGKNGKSKGNNITKTGK